MRFYPYMEMDIGAEGGAIESPSVVAEVTPSGEGNAPTPTETAGDVSKQQSFAQRLAEERTKIEREYADKYKGYDDYKSVAEYFREQNQAQDILSLKERIELTKLQEQAERQNVPVEVLQRINQLEEKATRADQYEQQFQNQQLLQRFQRDIHEFVKDKEGADPKALEDFMLENHIGNIEIAYRAMRAEHLEAQLKTVAQTTEKDTIRKLQNNAATSPGALGAEGSDNKVDFSKMSKADQQRMIDEVLRGERRSL